MKNNEREFYDVMSILKKHWLLNLFYSILLAMIILFISIFLIKPEYKSTASILINSSNTNEDAETSLNDIQLNQKLVNTYTELLKTRGIAEQVIDNLDLDLTYEEFKEKVSINTKQNTEVFEITVVDSIPERASDIVNETSNVFKDSIVKIMNIDNIHILDKGIPDYEPSSPHIKMNTIISFIIGLILFNFISITREIVDSSVKSTEEITEYFDIPVIGVIPDKKQG